MSLYNVLLYSGSTSEQADLNSDFFFTEIIKLHDLHVSDNGTRRWRCGTRRSYRDLCKSVRVTDTFHTTTCGNQSLGQVRTIYNSYQRSSCFTSLYENLLSQLMVLWTYSILLYKCRENFSKQASTSSIHIFHFFFFLILFCKALLLTASLNTHKPQP